MHVKVHDHELQLWVCPLLHEIHVPTRNRLVVVPLPPSACSSQLTLLLSCNPVSCVAERTQRAPRNRRLGQYRDLPFSFAMNLNSSSDEEEAPTVHPSQLQPLPPPPPVLPLPPAPTGVTTDSMDVGMEAVCLAGAPEELDSRTLGVPGLKTLMPGDCVEVLWRHGAAPAAPC